MVVVKSPLASRRASGTLADTLVYRYVAGRDVAGRASRPRQPRTQAQRASRLFMNWITKQWAAIVAGDRSTWLNYAETPLLSPYHCYLRHNLNRIKHLPGTNDDPNTWHNWPSQAYPTGHAGTPRARIGETITPGVGYIDYTRTITAVNDNWGVAYFNRGPALDYPTYNNLVHIERIQTLGSITTRIANLAPGMTFIRFVPFTVDGATTPYQYQFNAVVL